MIIIALLALIGAKLSMGVAYWILFSVYSLVWGVEQALKIASKK